MKHIGHTNSNSPFSQRQSKNPLAGGMFKPLACALALAGTVANIAPASAGGVFAKPPYQSKTERTASKTATIVEMKAPAGHSIFYVTNIAGNVIAGLDYSYDVILSNVVTNDPVTVLPQLNQLTIRAVNSSAVIVGSVTVLNGVTPHRIWTTQASEIVDGNIKILGLLEPYDKVAEALGINSNGKVVGYSEHATSGSSPFIYQNGKMSIVPGFKASPIQNSRSGAVAINDGGAIAGFTYTPKSGGYQGCSWVELPGASQPLPPFACTPVTGGLVDSAPVAINASGEVAGWYSVKQNNTGQVEYVDTYTWKNGVFTDLGARFKTYATCSGLNNLGQIVGFTETKIPYAYLYDPKHDKAGYQNLNKFLPPNSGWVLQNAISINDNGVIVGWGTYRGRYAYFIMQLPQN